MNIRIKWWLSVFFCCWQGVASVHSATNSADEPQASMYRYKNAEGVWELTKQLPPEAYQYGYQALDSSGRVLETIAPPPTEEQLKAAQEHEQLRVQQQQQAEKDQQLLKTYSSVEDAIRARDRKVEQMQVMADITQARIHQMQADNERLVADAANAQQLGQTVYENIVNKMKVNEQEIARLQQFIDGKVKERQALIEEYQLIIDRLKYLNAPAGSASNTPSPSVSPAPISPTQVNPIPVNPNP